MRPTGLASQAEGAGPRGELAYATFRSLSCTELGMAVGCPPAAPPDALGLSLHRPAWSRVPGAAALGRVSQGQRLFPTRWGGVIAILCRLPWRVTILRPGQHVHSGSGAKEGCGGAPQPGGDSVSLGNLSLTLSCGFVPIFSLALSSLNGGEWTHSAWVREPG